MSTQRLLFVNNYGDFMNWSDCIEAINVTGQALYQSMKNTVEEEGIKPLLEDIRLFFEHNEQYMTLVGDKVYTIRQSHRCCCTKCMPFFNIIEEKFIQPSDPIYIEDPKAAGEPCSILLRMCLMDKGKYLQKIRDCDLKILCKVMERCPLFETPPNTKQVIADRNALMHSSSNEISDSLKKDYLTSFETLLLDCDNVVAGEALYKIAELKSNKHQTDITKIERRITTQITAIENDQEEGDNSLSLDVVLKMVKENKGTVADAKRIKRLREATLNEAIQAGSVEGADALRAGGIVGVCLGSLSGGVGAYAAGYVKKGLDALRL